MIHKSERMIPYDTLGDHWAPWVITIRGYLGRDLINWSKEE
jgi:hypothetical protein